MRTWLLIGIFLMALRFALYAGVSFFVSPSCSSLRPSPLAKCIAAFISCWRCAGYASVPIVILMLGFGVACWPLGLGDIIFFSYRWLKGSESK